MKFGEKVRELRAAKGLSQAELAKLVGVSARTIASYEAGTSYPRYHDFYGKLAEVLGTDEDYLRTENENFPENADVPYGISTQKQFDRALNEVRKLFAGGNLPPEDEIAFIQEVQRLYLDSKERTTGIMPRRYSEWRDESKDD